MLYAWYVFTNIYMHIYMYICNMHIQIHLNMLQSALAGFTGQTLIFPKKSGMFRQPVSGIWKQLQEPEPMYLCLCLAFRNSFIRFTISDDDIPSFIACTSMVQASLWVSILINFAVLVVTVVFEISDVKPNGLSIWSACTWRWFLLRVGWGFGAASKPRTQTASRLPCGNQTRQP